jgi:ubiquinone/menaquinone biosynthesis C-methylase UbiE
MNENELKKAIQSAFNEASAGYDRAAMRFFDNSAEELARALPLRGSERVLDAATGTGKVALALARRLKDGEVTGIDLSEGMLALAAKKAREAGLTNVSFLQADVDAVELPSGFDGLTCGFAVHFWPDMEKSLSRLAGLVRKGGFVGITSFAKGSFEPHSKVVLKKFADFGVKLPESYALERLDHPDKVAALYKAVGLKDPVCHRVQVGYDLEGAGDWWDLVRYSGYRAFLNQLSPGQAARYMSEFLEEIEASAGGKPISLNVEIITAVAVK